MAGLREGSQNLDYSGKGFLDGHILLWTLQHILWTVCKSWISVTLFLDMNPMILSPFFLLRSTHTKGPDTSGPSILPITNLIWNTSECQSLSFLLAWLWSVDEIRAELTPTINAFIVPANKQARYWGHHMNSEVCSGAINPIHFIQQFLKVLFPTPLDFSHKEGWIWIS